MREILAGGMCQRVPADEPDWLEQHLTRDGPPDILEACGYQCTVPADYHLISAAQEHGLPAGSLKEEDPDFVEIEFPSFYSKLLPDCRPVTEGDIAVLRVYLQSGVKTAVIQRDTDNLTPDELAKHKDEVMAAMLKELQTWAKYKCFSRRPRAGLPASQ